MNNNESRNPFKPIINLFSRFNLVIFIVVVVGGLITSVLILTKILNVPYASTSTSNTNTTTFDESTIVRLETLKTSSDNVVDQQLPDGRINLFSE